MLPRNPSPASRGRAEGGTADPRCAPTQSQEHRRRHSAEPPRLHHRRVRVRQVDAGAGRSVSGTAQAFRQADRSAGRARAHRRRGRARRGRDGRPGTDRTHHALESGELRRRIRRDPQAVRGGAAREGARLHAGHLQLQLGHRPLPELRRQRLRARRNAVPVGRVSALCRVQWPALSRGDSRGHAESGRDARAQHRGRARPDGLASRRVLRRRARGARQAAAAGRGRAGLLEARAAGADTVRRRSAAVETRRPPRVGRRATQRCGWHARHSVPVRRAHDRPALRRHCQATARVPPAHRCRSLAARDRTQPRRDRGRGLVDRPRSRGRRCGRPGRW